MASLAQALLFAGASVASAFVALLILSLLDRNTRRPAMASLLAVGSEPTIFLFEGNELVDATPPARHLIGTLGSQGAEWDRLLSYLTPKFPGLTAALSGLSPQQDLVLQSPTDPGLRIRAEQPGPAIRLTLEDMAKEGQAIVVDGLSVRAQEEEIASLREALGALPVPVWRSDPGGNILWANEAYLAAARSVTGEDDLVWPLPVLFRQPSESGASGTVKRIGLPVAMPTLGQWFDCQAMDLGLGQLQMALPADRLVKAESSLREFIQTLSKTFAHLAVGLAIFDRERRLALFNPALTDLTTLGPEFLIARPTLYAFLDRLREARVLPEPKDYSIWRQKMNDLERAAAAGSYEETWTLATGQTYRVTGRPHPEGAVAFLIEDITAEISLTRRFRAEIELGQSVIDALDDALVVFSPLGELVLSNRAYARLWGIDPTRTLGSITIIDATRHWQGLTDPSPLWGNVREFVTNPADRAEWQSEVHLLSGPGLTCALSPISGGQTLIRFTKGTSRPLQVRHSRRPHMRGLADDQLLDA